MTRSKPEDSKPLDYFHEVKAAQKQEKPNVPNRVTALRSDMVPASDAQPAREGIVQREKLRVAVGILLGLVIIAFILFMLIGPGRPILERNLANLAHQQTTPTLTATSTNFPPTKTPPSPTMAPYTSPTAPPTKTPVVQIIASPTRITPSPTQIMPSLTPTQPGCRDVSTITLADVGKTLCVSGVVIETIINPAYFMVVFSNKPGAFYWVSYDLVWSKAELDRCYQITGKIDRIGNSPILVFNYDNLPEVCP